jgi:hypothetical protein
MPWPRGLCSGVVSAGERIDRVIESRQEMGRQFFKKRKKRVIDIISPAYQVHMYRPVILLDLCSLLCMYCNIVTLKYSGSAEDVFLVNLISFQKRLDGMFNLSSFGVAVFNLFH